MRSMRSIEAFLLPGTGIFILWAVDFIAIAHPLVFAGLLVNVFGDRLGRARPALR